MHEKIYTYELTVTLEGVKNNELHLLVTERNFSVDSRFYNNSEEALDSFLSFIQFASHEESAKLHFDKKPYIYEIITDKFSVQRIQLAPQFSHEACFLLDSFEELSFNDLISFLKDYCESDCSQHFDCISFMPYANSQVKVYQVHHFGFVFPKDFVINSSVEELKEHFLATKLIGYLHL